VSRYRVLVLSPYIPWPLRSGANIRIYASLRALGHFADLTLACPYYHFPEVAAAWGLKDQCQAVILARHDPDPSVQPAPAEISMRTSRRLLDDLDRRDLASEFDAVHVHFAYMGEYVAHCANRHPGLPIIFEGHNIEYDVLGRSDRQADMEAMRPYEEHVWRTAAHCIAVTERDRQMMAAVKPPERVSLLPNGVDCTHYVPRPASPELRLVFIGCLAYPPNTSAVAYFLEHVWPALRYSGLHFQVIGSGSSAPLDPLLKDQPMVSLHLNVPDERPYFDHNAIVVVPLWAGGGSRIKILTALAMGCPVVSTTIGAEGLDLQNGRHLLLADSSEAMQTAIQRLVRDDALRRDLGNQGRARVLEAYDWSYTLASMQEIYQAVLA
jgi:glycosyltransferase involved in cell wall biosynthesis